MKTHKILLFALLTIASAFSYAAAPALGADSVLGIIQSSMAPAIDKLTKQAMTWLAAFASLQFIITNFGVLKSDGDIQMVIAKLAGSLMWVGFCVFIIGNAPQFIGAVGDQMFGLLGLTLPAPGSIIASTIAVVSALAAIAVGVGGIGILGSTTAGMLLVYILLFILGIGMFFAFKIFMLKLELGLIVMLSPLSFAFLGLNSLKDQGIAPFKALISLMYRIILLTVILSAFTEVSNVASSALSGLSTDAILSGIGAAIMTVLSALGAYMMLAFLVYKSDSIAASLASGSTSMGTGDIASAAAAGAAAGAMVASGGASAAAGAGNAQQSMSDFMKGMGGGSGSISNASGIGSGQTPAAAPSRPSLSTGTASTGSTSGGKGSAPVRPGGSGAPGSESVGSAPSSFGGADASSVGGQAEALGGAAETAADVGSGLGSSSPMASGGAPVRPADSGLNSGLTGASSSTDQKMDKLIESIAQQGQPSKVGLRDRLKDVNQHIAQEKSATHVSINTHHSD